MKVIIYAFISIAFLSVPGCTGGSFYGQGIATTTITINPSAMTLGTAAYGTNPLHLPLNTVVDWYNSDSVSHSATTTVGAPKSFDTGILSPGQVSGAFTLNIIGTYNYQCTIHGALMTGTIIVP
jgi:plastocyanin